MNHWSLELATYNITFKWISSAHNKAAAANILVNLVTASPTDRPVTHIQSKTKVLAEATTPDTTKVNAPPPLIGYCKDILLQMQAHL